MENKDTTLRLFMGLVVIVLIVAVGLTMNHNKTNVEKAEDSYISSLQKRDSLQTTIDSLKSEIEIMENDFDSKEHRYEDIIGEYEIGLSYLKDYHPKAYKDFHRIIGMKERYSSELDKENKKRLSIYE